MEHDTIIVEYYYVRPAKVIVNYIEQATGKELSEKVEMNGYDGEDYVTEAKEVKYYNLVKEPENKAGKYAINVVIDEDGKEIVDDTIIVNYYYEKKNFNLTIDKNINSIIVNGKEQVVNGKLGKVEVYRKELGTAKIQVVYTISVKNIGELAGKATIMENIPRGMKMLSKDNAGWKIENSEATYETGMIEPGKTQDIKVVFVWENVEANIGTIQNIAQIIGTESESGFAQSDEKDDADGADVIVAIGTGDSSYVVTMGLILTVLSAGALVVAKKVKE